MQRNPPGQSVPAQPSAPIAEDAPPYAPSLNDSEQQEVAERTAIPAVVVHEAIRTEGEAELRRPTSALAWSGLAAGLSMGFSLVAEGVMQAHLPDAPWRPLLSKFGYSLGFLLVILGRQQLFTENTVTAIVPLLTRRDRTTLWQVVRLWSVVLSANILGTVLFALVVGLTEVFPPNVRQVFAEIGHHAMAAAGSTTFLRAIFAGWLIALMVWLLPAAESARVAIVVILTFIVGLADFAHIIAGSVEAVYVVVIGEASWLRYVAHFFLPTLLGNILGGVALVAALNHAQVVAGSATPQCSGGTTGTPHD